MKEFIKLIKEYKTTKNKKSYFLVLLERSVKIHFPIYSLIQLLNSISNDSNKIISSEGWIEKDFGLKKEKKDFEKEKAELVKAKSNFKNEKQKNLLLKRSYLIIPVVVSVFLIVFFVIIPIYKSSEENKYWDRVCIENTMVSYEKYINHYPEGKHVNEALRKQDVSNEKEDENTWNRVVRTNTKKSYLNYINSNKKDAKYKEDAKEKLDEIDWTIAQNQNTYVFYKNYINLYPNGRHVVEANIKKNRIAIQDINLVVISWINCWQEKDLNCFNSFISNDYTYETATGDKKNQSQDKSKRLSNLKNQFDKRSFIRITVNNMKIKLLEDKMAIANYSQKYESNNWNDEGLKTIYLKFINNEWKIYKDIFEK